MRRLLPPLLALAFASLTCAAGVPNPRLTGAPLLRAWTAEDYGGAPVNYHAIQHPGSGLLYVANDDGVLEFDGANWRLIEMPNGLSARALAVDGRGRVWVGGAGEIALLTPDAKGTMHAASVLDRLPAPVPRVGIVTSAVAAPGGVYFITDTGLLFFPLAGAARVEAAPAGANVLLWFDETLHAATAGGGLFGLRGTNWDVEIPATGTAAIFAARAHATGGWELLTARGPAEWQGPGTTPSFARTAARAELDAAPAASGVFLHDGTIAFGRAVGGVAVFQHDGTLGQVLDRTRGLAGNRVQHMFEDQEGGLWIAQRSGLARVQLDSPLAKHGVAQGVDGRPRALHRHEGRLYLAHNEGGAWRDDATGQFHPIQGLEVGLKRFLSLGPRLLSTSNVIFDLAGDRATPLARINVSPLVPVPGTPTNAPALLGGGATNLWLLSPTPDAWQIAGPLTQVPAGAESLQATGDGYVWASSVDGRVWRIDFRNGPKLDAPVKLYGPDGGVPAIRRRDDAELVTLGGELLAISGAWILRYDRAADRFVSAKGFAGLPQDASVTHAHVDASGTLWLQLALPDGGLWRIRPAPAASLHAEKLDLPGINGLAANRIYHDEVVDTLWLACQGTLVSVDLAWRPTRPAVLPRARIRRVETAARQLIFDGAVSPASAAAAVDPSQRNLRFAFAAPAFTGDFAGHGQTEYRTRLAGLESDWTPWSVDTVREFSSLPFRPLTFQVEARGPDGHVGPAAGWSFTIAPPWWRTNGMVIVYVLGVLAGVMGFVRWRTQRLRRRAAELESVVATRTEELRQSNAELARLHAVERNEKLAARFDEEKARLEVLRYQLNPHFLYNTLASICGTARTNPDATRTMAQRLADFCRLTLTRADEAESLREELRLLQTYLDIEKARWRDALEIEINVAPEALDRRLPTFLLLPLIENAIKHGGRTTRGTLHLRLTIRVNDEAGLVIEVANTGKWDPAARQNSTGIGLENMRRRLARHFPGTHAFTIGPEGDHVIARLRLGGRMSQDDGQTEARPPPPRVPAQTSSAADGGQRTGSSSS